MPKKEVKKGVVVKSKTTTIAMGIESININDILDYVRKEVIRLRDDKDYRKEKEEQFGDRNSYIVITAITKAVKKIDELSRRMHAHSLGKIESLNATAITKINQNLNTYGQTVNKVYKNTDLVLKGIKQEAELLKKLYNEIKDTKKKNLELTESLRSEFITGVNNIQRSINIVSEQMIKQMVKISDDQLNALNTLGVSNTKVIESVKKEGDNIRTMVDAKLSEIKNEIMEIVKDVKENLSEMMVQVNDGVSNSVNEISTSVDEIKGAFERFKEENKATIDEANNEVIRQLKAIAGGLSKQSIDETQRILEEVKSMGEVITEMETKLNETVEKQESVFEESMENMRKEVVDGAAKQIEAMKKDFNEFKEGLKEELNEFKANVEKYLKKEIAELRDSLSTIRADIEMQKHLLNTLVEKVRK